MSHERSLSSQGKEANCHLEQRKIHLNRRRRRILSGLIPVAIGFASANVIGQMAIADHAIAAVVKAVRDPGALLASRSPGQRPEGAMMSSKGSQALRSPSILTVPPEFVRHDQDPHNGPLEPVAFFGQPDIPPPGELPQEGAPGPMTVEGPWGGPYSPAFGLPIVIPGGNGPAPAPGEPSQPVPPDSLPVPEPATWAMLIVGFFIAGQALRHRRHGRVILAQ